MIALQMNTRAYAEQVYSMRDGHAKAEAEAEAEGRGSMASSSKMQKEICYIAINGLTH